MKAATTPFDQIADRLNRLERRNRQLALVLACLLAGGGIVLLTAAQEVRHPSGETQTRVLRDGAGTVRARLEMGTDGPVLQFLDGQGHLFGTLGATRDALVLGLVNADGHLQTGVALQRDGIAAVSHDRDGRLQTGHDVLLQTSGSFARK